MKSRRCIWTPHSRTDILAVKTIALIGDQKPASVTFPYGTVRSQWDQSRHVGHRSATSRLPPINRHAQRPSACLKRATNGLVCRSKYTLSLDHFGGGGT